MSNDNTIVPYACAFLEALSAAMTAQTAVIAASGDPSAPKDHFTLMTLHNKLVAIPRLRSDWASYADNVRATTAAYQHYLRSGGFYGAAIVGSITRDIDCLLNEHAPPPGTFRELMQFFARA